MCYDEKTAPVIRERPVTDFQSTGRSKILFRFILRHYLLSMNWNELQDHGKEPNVSFVKQVYT
jgi:hypothetical protein